MNQKPIQKRTLQPPRPQARVIIGSSQIKRTNPAMNSTQNRNFNQPTTTTTAATTNTQSSNNNSRNIGQNYNSNNSSHKESARNNSKNTRLPPPASMISSNLRAVGKIFLTHAFTMLIFLYSGWWCKDKG